METLWPILHHEHDDVLDAFGGRGRGYIFANQNRCLWRLKTSHLRREGQPLFSVQTTAGCQLPQP
jgi:hypothetical protein